MTQEASPRRPPQHLHTHAYTQAHCRLLRSLRLAQDSGATTLAPPAALRALWTAFLVAAVERDQTVVSAEVSGWEC